MLPKRHPGRFPFLLFSPALLLLLLSPRTAAVITSIPHQPCSSHLDAGSVIDVRSVQGDLPVRAGKEFIVTVRVTPNAVLDGGKIVMVVKAMGVAVMSRSFNICKDIGIVCPVAPQTSVNAVFHFPVPWYAITMKADVVINALDARGQSLACVEANQVPVVRRGHVEPLQNEEPHAHLAEAPTAEAGVCVEGGRFESTGEGTWALVCDTAMLTDRV